MTEVSSTRLYLGNLPRNGMQSFSNPSPTLLPKVYCHFDDLDTPVNKQPSALQQDVLWITVSHLFLLTIQGICTVHCALTLELRGLSVYL